MGKEVWWRATRPLYWPATASIGPDPLGVTLDLSRAPATPAAPPKPNITGMTRDELRAAIVAAGVAPPEKARMRAGQVWRWVHHYGVTDFEAMTDIAKDARPAFAEAFTLARPEVVERQVS